MATIPHVTPDTVIEAAAQNALIDEVNNNCVKDNAAGTITSTLTATQMFISAGQNVAANALTRKDYVDTKLALAGGAMTGNINLGGPPANGNGLDLEVSGHIDSSIVGTTGSNMTLARGGTPSADPGGRFISFYRGATPTGPQDVNIGSISIVTGGASVAYNTTSDERLKNVVGDIDDPLGRIGQLVPRRLAWKTDETATFDGFLAHEVQTVAPYAVTGLRGAVLPADDPNNPGGIDPQQLDAAKLVPLLVAAVQALTARVAELEGAA